MFLQDDFIQTPYLKRIFDILLSLIILVVLSSLLFLIIILMFLEMLVSKQARGSLLYCETRISNGKEFKFCKLRTCRQSAYIEEQKKHGEIHTCNVEGKRENFLKIGWLIKKIYMDEAPQFFSVLKGDLSLVGPRPKPVAEYNDLVKNGDYSKKIIKCGLTGLLQSHKGYLENFEQNLDYEYIEFCQSHSAWQIIWYDMKILLRTIKVVFEHKGI
jgi:lipopolysaccharide/colanic/teichoic acid biosynthesis glycosyltransferase